MITSRQWRKALATNATNTSFASKIATITEPTNDGVISLCQSLGGPVPKHMLVVPFATSGDNDTMDMRIIGWRRLTTTGLPGGTLWIPHVLGQFTCTMSAAVGVAGAPVVATERFADTIIIHATIITQEKTTDVVSAAAASTGGIWINSPANDLIGMIDVRTKGFEKMELTFDTTAVGTTDMNALVSFW